VLSVFRFDRLPDMSTSWSKKRMGAEVRGPSPCHRGDSGTLGGEDSTFAAGEGRLNNDCRSPDRQI